MFMHSLLVSPLPHVWVAAVSSGCVPEFVLMYCMTVGWVREPIAAPRAAQVRKEEILEVLLLLSTSHVLSFQSLFSGMSGCACFQLVTFGCERRSQRISTPQNGVAVEVFGGLGEKGVRENRRLRRYIPSCCSRLAG